MDAFRRAIVNLMLASILVGQFPLPAGAQDRIELPLSAQAAGKAPGGEAIQEAPAGAAASSDPTPRAEGAARAAAEERREARIDPELGGRVELGGVSVELPPGAVREATTISIRRLESIEDTGDGIANVTSGAKGYRFEPHGIRFEKAVVVRVPFDRRLLGSEVGLSNLYTYFYDESSGRWERLTRKGIDRSAAIVASETTHFTDMINATLKLPEGPKPIQFDVNSIKNLEAADPADEVPKPEGPEPSAFGSNSFSLPLRLPAGRGGATPKLALSYSSDASNGWLGRGFDISAPAVTTDTRFGLPKYDGNDTYSFGGEELERISAVAASTYYRPRVEKAFQLIRWVRSGGENYWEVTDKDGTVREYGRGEGWIGPSRGSRTRTFTWYLTKQRDAFGNAIEYDYAYDSTNAYAYLSAIRYSSFESGGTTESGLFRVDFIREAREDRRSEARGGFPSKLAQRLARIDVSVSGARLRSYLFDYGAYNEFGQSQLRSFTETDKSGNAFYTYSFEYFALGAHPDGSGAPSYDGFGLSPSELSYENWNVGDKGKYDGLASSMNASINGSLSTGFRFYRPKFWRPGRKKLAELSIHGGIGASIGGSTGTLLDANSDGRPDLVWRESGRLYAFLNTGSAFDSTKPFSLSGISSVMDKESSYNTSYGATASFSSVGGSVSKQESWSSSETSFSDVDGDGRVDFLKEGSSNFDLNTGSGFSSTPWAFGSAGDSGDSAERDDGEYQAMYYLQEPVRAWQAWRSGTVEVAMKEASLLDAGRQAPLSLRSYAPGSQTDSSSWMTLSKSGASPLTTHSYSMDARQRLFFHEDTGGDERGAGVDWRISVRYTSIKLFESLAQGVDFLPRSRLTSAEISGLGDLYTYDSMNSVYNLDSDWRDELGDSEREILAKQGRFVAHKVDESVFSLMLASAKAAPDNDPSAAEDDDDSVKLPSHTSDYQRLITGYGYDPAGKCFLRLKPSEGVDESTRTYLALYLSAIDDSFMKYVLATPGISDDMRIALTRIAAVDRVGYVSPSFSADGSTAWYGRSSASATLGADILPLSRASQAIAGMKVEGKGILLDTRTDPFSGKAERLWLRTGSPNRIYSEIDGEETELSAAGPSLSHGSGTLDVGMHDYKVPRSFHLADASYLLASLPRSVYEGGLSDYLLAGKSFSSDSYRKLPKASFDAIGAGLSNTPPAEGLPSDRACFESAYAPSEDGSAYELIETVSTADLEKVLAFEQASVTGSNPFYSLPGDPALRLVRLSASAYSSFTGAEGSDFSADFALSADGAYRYPKRDLDADELDRLLDAMKAYCRDVQTFAYYARDAARDCWKLKKAEGDLTDPEKQAITDVMTACGLYAYTSISKGVTYSSSQTLDVAAAKLPSGASVTAFAPTGGRVDAAGSDVGLALVPVIDDAGNASLRPYYLHIYDSSTDYSSADLTASGGEWNEASSEYFSGGMQGWYYGIWTGNYAWDADKLGIDPDQSGKNIDDGDVANPPYSAAASPNTQASGGRLISLSGRDSQVAVPAEAWVGEVSSYGAAALSDDLTPTTVTYRFAAFMDGAHWYPGRHGGDSYYNIPNKDGAIGSGGSLSFIRESHSKGKDRNLPTGFSTNSSDSWQYCGLMDMNGDRYPDLVKFRDSKSGSQGFTVVAGTGKGFGESSRYSLPSAGLLSKNETSAWGVGSSTGSAMGGLLMMFSPRGRAVSSEAAQDGTDAGSGFSLNGSLNASFGSSIQTASFIDMNGDGLPDYVSRGGTSAYGVALNGGDGSFRSAGWGSNVISATAFSGISGIGSIALQGISHTSTGSLGGNLSVGFSVGFGSAGLSVGLSGNTNQTLSNLVDMNGDGLPDIVVKKPGDDYFRVRFNLGDKFADAETRIYRPQWPSQVDEYQFNASRELKQLLGGLNGIGLLGHDISGSVPDLGSITIPYASSNPFVAAVNPFQIDDDLEYSTGASINLGANVTIEFGFWLIEWYIQPSVSGSVARTSVDLKFTDIDGDGLPDHVLKMPSSTSVFVKRNLMGKVGLLKTMRLPQGGSYAFDYEREGNTTDMPQSRWVLSSLVKEDGSAGTYADRGAHSYSETFAYSGGYYDRKERMFFGFASVSATKGDGSVATTSYLNEDYYLRGQASGTELRGPDAQGQIALYQESQRTIAKAPITGSSGKQVYFPAVTAETKRQYEAGSSRYVETGSSYDYEYAYGNVEVFRDLGLADDSSDDIIATIHYADLGGYLRQHPDGIRVTDASGKLLRRREGSYGNYGELLTVKEYDSDTSSRTHNLGYDKYGNLASIADPRGYRLSWAYEGADHAFPTLFSRGNQALGSPTYASSATWSLALGKKLSETDENGRTMSYAYDDFGRLAEVRSPYDTGAKPAVAHAYDISSFPWTATTRNKLLYDPSDDRVMRTIIAIDGLGRALQTAKEGEFRDSEENRRYGWNLSGAIAYDAKARQVAEGQPQFAETAGAPAIGAMVRPTTTSYDALDRPLKKLLPDGAAMTTEYLVSGGLSLERNVDPLGNATEKRSDGRGNATALRRLSSSGAVLMSASYTYNGLGEMLTALDSKSNAVKLSYDLSGKRTSLESPDSGKVILSYDEAGNLATKTDSALRGRGEVISYEYDGLERLVKVKYPRTTATQYYFGEAGAGNGGAGRLVRRTDASGTVDYEYGGLGETTAMTRSLDRLTPLAENLGARFEYASDYLGRMQRITYPDGEILSYGYDTGGQLKSAASEHNGLSTIYVADIAYDAFGQRTYIEYGNGVRTSYAYDENRRWLSTIKTDGSMGTTFQNMSYRFDLVGNVSGYANSATGYETKQSYYYDGLYQLTKAEGTSISRPLLINEYTSNYTQNFSYDSIGNMTKKASSCLTSPSRAVGDDLNYTYDYSYFAGKAHQAERIGNRYYRYDANGNMIEEREGGHGTSEVLAGTVYQSGDLRMTDTGFGIVRQASGSGGSEKTVYCRSYAWDEENRLIRSADNGIAVDYRYGADGQRTAKYSSRGESMYFDSMWAVQTDGGSLRQMKNVYVAQTRIATRLTISGEETTGYERQNTYYYHPDHLGSAQLVTDYQGKEYERIEYTPYGESWIEKTQDGLELLPYKFTGKELDSETGLYYYGARYLNPKTSAWISADPALGDYIPMAPVDEEARKHNGKLPGMGGVFNPINFALYHYAGNNPVTYTDPNGKETGWSIATAVPTSYGPPSPSDLLKSRVTNGSIPALSLEGPCLMASLQGIAESYAGRNLTAAEKTQSVADLVSSGAMKDSTGYLVLDSKAVIVDALSRLGVDTSKLNITVARPEDKNYNDVKASATASLRHVGRSDGVGGAAHWEQGDSKGGFVWDPISGTSDGGRKNYPADTRYIIIAPKKEEE